MSKRWGAKSRRQICSANSTHLMEPSPCQEDYITLQKLERGSDCWKHCPQSLTKSKRSPVWRRRRNCSAYEYQSGVLLHPYHTCIAVLQCDTHQESSQEERPSLLRPQRGAQSGEEVIALHMSTSLEYSLHPYHTLWNKRGISQGNCPCSVLRTSTERPQGGTSLCHKEKQLPPQHSSRNLLILIQATKVKHNLFSCALRYSQLDIYDSQILM